MSLLETSKNCFRGRCFKSNQCLLANYLSKIRFTLIIFIVILLPYKICSTLGEDETNENNFLPEILQKIANVEQIKKETQSANKSSFLRIPEKKNIKKLKSEFTKLTLESIMQSTNNFKSFSIPLAKYFLKFSSFAYCSEERMKSQTCCPEIFKDEKWVLLIERKVSYDNYNYAILASFKFKNIIVAFPGTRGPLQLLKELLYSNGVPFSADKTEKIMSYLKNVYSLFKDYLEKTLEELAIKYRNYQFIFTGHSLGGSIAAISALNSVKYGSMKRLADSPVLITYGQPRVGNDVFANQLMKYVPIVYRITRYGDIVTNIPPCNWIFPGKYLNKCKGILPGYLFDPGFDLDQKSKEDAEKHYYKWHLGGWMHFDDAMNEYTDCGRDKGENFEEEKCQLYLDLDVDKHVEYFGLKVSEVCEPH